MSEVSSPHEPDLARELRLHYPPAPVTRLSRRVLIALGAAGCLAVIGAVVWAMVEKPHGQGQGELFNTEGQHPPDAMAALPADYASVPKLGPPLPGDLGKPILNAGQTGDVPVPAVASPAAAAADPVRQRLSQERESARTSRLFTDDGSVHGGAAAPDAPTTLAEAAPAPTAAAGTGSQGGNVAFLNAPVDRRTTSSERLQAPASPYVVQAGTVIPAALITGLRSDLPGQITAQVTQNVYDSPSGRYLLIPQGSRLIGEYDSQIAFGQSRVLLAWTRLILPGGRSMVLEKDPGADESGFAGLQEGVDHHWKQLFSAALLSTVLGAGAQAGATGTDSQIVQALRQGAANSMNQVGQQVVGKSLDVQPTLTIRPGFPVDVVVTRDLVLEPVAN
jgi:type IV secretion system protein VirB10